MKYWRLLLVSALSLAMIVVFQNCGDEFNQEAYSSLTADELPENEPLRDDPIAVIESPVINAQLKSSELQEDQDISLVIQATGTDLTYQWMKDGQNLSLDQATNTLTITKAKETDTGIYAVVVSNSSGSARSEASLKVHKRIIAPLAILPHELNVDVFEGTSQAVLQVTASGENLTYQWYRVVQKGDQVINGATSNQLIIERPVISDSGNYKIVVTSGSQQVSATISLQVDVPCYNRNEYECL